MTRFAVVAACCATVALACTACGADGPPTAIAAEAIAADPGAADPATTVEPAAAVPLAGDQRSDAAPDPEAGSAGAPPVATVEPAGPAAMPLTATVIGDSIALSAQSMVTAALESLGIEVEAYDAVESRRMVAGSATLPSGADAVEGVLTAGVTSELWIVALGTNDVGARADQATVRADIARLLALVPADAELMWIDTWVRDLDPEAVTMNELLREALAGRPNSWVLDWHGHAATDGLIIADGVHLTAAGKIEFARMIGDALRATFSRP